MRFVVSFAVLLLSACASVDPRPSFDRVATEVRLRSGFEVGAAESLAGELLAQPLDADGAARVALLRNRALRAEIEELGIAQADFAQAARLANPSFSASRRDASGGGANVELSLAADLLDVLVQPARKRLAAVELEAAKLRLGQAMLDLVADVRIHFHELQAARQTVDRFAVVRDLTAAAAELARRQQAAGNLEELEVARLEAAEAEAAIELARAELARGAAREQLHVLLGLSGAELEWRVAGELQPLPAVELDALDHEARALAGRLDLGAARFGVDLVSRALALKRGTRYFPVGIEVGVDREREPDGVRLTGPQLSIALPIFDTGAASIAKLEAEERRARRQLEQRTLEVGAEVRLATAEVRSARALVETYQRVLLPKRRVSVEQTLLSYNMMLIGVYDLLAARRDEAEAEGAAIAALRDYWIARAKLERAVGSRLGPEIPSRGEP